MADLTEKEVYEVFGLDEKAQEAVEPAQEPAPEGENGQEIAAPAQEAPAAAAEESDSGERDFGQMPMSAEQRRENAARRRQAETRAAVEQAVAQERKRNEEVMKDLFAKAGLKNTVTGAPITTMEEFRQWNQEFERNRLERELKSGKLTQEGLNAAISAHPAMQQVNAYAQAQQQRQRAEQQAQAQARIDSEIKKISKVDASIHSLADLLNASYGRELYDMTKRGYSLSDAHFLLNHKRLEDAKLEAAKAQAAAAARGKDHLTATGKGRGSGTLSVPNEELRMFRAFNPDATDAQIQAAYNQYMKK